LIKCPQPDGNPSAGPAAGRLNTPTRPPGEQNVRVGTERHRGPEQRLCSKAAGGKVKASTACPEHTLKRKVCVHQPPCRKAKPAIPRKLGQPCARPAGTPRGAISQRAAWAFRIRALTRRLAALAETLAHRPVPSQCPRLPAGARRSVRGGRSGRSSPAARAGGTVTAAGVNQVPQPSVLLGVDLTPGRAARQGSGPHCLAADPGHGQACG
jgi:hypothetical protein